MSEIDLPFLTGIPAAYFVPLDSLPTIEWLIIDGVITTMSEQRQGLGTLADIPEQSRQELRELGLYDHFAAAEAEHAQASKTSPSNPPKGGGRA